MPDADRARKYLAAQNLNMKAASIAVGRNHAYLQQYIRTGKPRWLPEQVRDALAALYGVDPDRLRPPPAKLRTSGGSGGSNGQHKTKINAPGHGQLADDPRAFELMEVWDAIPADRRDLALRVLRGFAGDASAPVAL